MSKPSPHKRCPFCGDANPNLLQTDYCWLYVSCRWCHARTRSVRTGEAAWAAWDRRVAKKQEGKRR